MRDYGKVHSQFWASSTIAALSDDGKLLALYLMTCQHNTIAGVFRLPDGYAAEDLGWSPERVREGFAELSRNGFANRCETTKWVWIIKHLDWNPPENPNQRKAALKCSSQVPENCDWRARFLGEATQKLIDSDSAAANPSATLPKPLPNQEQEQEQKQDKKAPRALPSALTVDDLKAEGVSEEAAYAFLAIRKRKRAPLSQLAWAGIKREAGKAGWGLDAAVRKAAERGWQSFEAEWVRNEPPTDGGSKWAGAI